ncbi:BrnA antitoxin family protein [Pinisolibacter sp.]|uniref:BrnA antitoxin family protein n=1 Tax=Pinisolibacter sp. TaxID=2172024 RepID=UPI002FDD19F4
MNVNRDASKTPSGAWTDPDDPPEWSDEMFERAELYIGSTLIRRGRGDASPTKVTVGLRLSADVVARFRATGRGWHARIDRALRDWLADHPDAV